MKCHFRNGQLGSCCVIWCGRERCRTVNGHYYFNRCIQTMYRPRTNEYILLTWIKNSDLPRGTWTTCIHKKIAWLLPKLVFLSCGQSSEIVERLVDFKQSISILNPFLTQFQWNEIGPPLLYRKVGLPLLPAFLLVGPTMSEAHSSKSILLSSNWLKYDTNQGSK